MSILNLNTPEVDKRPLHERRWAEAKRKAADDSFRRAAESAGIILGDQLYGSDGEDSVPDISSESSLPKDDLFGNNDNSATKGKDTKFRPLVYYTEQEALKKVMDEFKDQAKKNIDLIREAREAKGQRIATKLDLKDVMGEFHEGKRSIFLGISSVAYKVFIREWCGAICIFDMLERYYGTGQMKRRGYIIEKVSVVYYQKNGVGLAKEIILKHPANYCAHHPDKDKKSTSSKPADSKESTNPLMSSESVGGKFVKRLPKLSLNNVAEYWKHPQVLEATKQLKANLNNLLAKKGTRPISLKEAKTLKCRFFHKVPKEFDINGIKSFVSEKVINGIPVILNEVIVDNAHVGTSQIWFTDKSGKAYGCLLHPDIFFSDLANKQ